MKRYLITSALPYINGIKHLGNLVGSMLPADVLARYLRQRGELVLFLCGTDEHGTPAEIAASESGLDVQTYCDDLFVRQREIYEQFMLSFDYFGRSSSPTNHEFTQEVFLSLLANGYIYKKLIQQMYSVDEQRFLPDRYLIGTCPKCGYDKARGDQCDGCSSLLDPLDLITPRSAISGSYNLEVRETEHFFFSLSSFDRELHNWTQSKVGWPSAVTGVARKWLNEGLKDRCITRDNQWGVKIPLDDLSEKVFYVWFDAPNTYVSLTQDWASAKMLDDDEWMKWWAPESDEICYYQFMAKDNLPFHTIFWPAMVIGSKKDIRLVDYIKGFNWLLYDGGKFSTSQGRGIFLDQALDLYPSDYWRFYLMSIAPESSDSNFTFDHFASVINSDLVNSLGNFVNRTLALIQRHFDGCVSGGCGEFDHENEELMRLIEALSLSYENLKYGQVINEIRSLWKFCNTFITKREPWVLVKNAKPEATNVLAYCCYLIKVCAVTSAPIIPASSKKILGMIGVSSEPGLISFAQLNPSFYQNECFRIHPSEILFSKITEEEVEVLTEKYNGLG